MSIWNMISKVVGTTIMVAAMACTDGLVAELQHGQLTGPEQAGSEERTPQEAGVWPDNEPPAMEEILFVDGTSKDWPGFGLGGAWRDDKRVAVVADDRSKYGYAIEKRFFVGDKSGWRGLIHRGDFGAYRELYFRQVFRLSKNWQWHRSGGKYFYYGAAGRKSGTAPKEFILGWRASGETRWIDFSSGSGEYVANNAPKITRDVYHTIEIHHVASTSGANGSLRMWIDGVEVQSFNHVGNSRQNAVSLLNRAWRAQSNLSDKRLTGIEAFMFWGGQGDTKRVNDWVRISEFYISGRR